MSSTLQRRLRLEAIARARATIGQLEHEILTTDPARTGWLAALRRRLSEEQARLDRLELADVADAVGSPAGTPR